MPSPQKLLIFGASTRAAAFSALRAGIEPWCADLFADVDLQARCPVMRLPAGTYPRGFRELVRQEIPGPWMYTGGLENYSRLIAQMTRARSLWGNPAKVLRLSRSPQYVAAVLTEARLSHPAVFGVHPLSQRAGGDRWLVKPLGAAGGHGIYPVRGRLPRVYFQERIEGVSCSAVFLGKPAEEKVLLLGVTQQLVGESWLHAAPFSYCGSIGPVDSDPIWEQMGRCLGVGCGLRGLFGVDCVVRDGVPFPVEINPRYTASVEILEYAADLRALEWHRWAFDGGEQPSLALRASKEGTIIGKAILFARSPLIFPADGPWMDTLRQPGDIWQLPDFADIPHPGTQIKEGQPIFSFFIRADSPETCRAKLQEQAAQLDRILFGG